MSYIYERRYNNFQSDKNTINTNRNNKMIGEAFNPYQPKIPNTSKDNQHFYYSTINTLKKFSSINTHGYNHPSHNYGNQNTLKYKSARKNGNDPLISNSYNIINNFNSNRNFEKNLTMYNKRFSNKKDSISKLLNYENKKREKQQFYFSNKKNKKIYNNDYKQSENISGNINYIYSTSYNQIKPIKPATAPENILSNNNLNNVIKSLESDSKKNDKIIQEK